MAPTKPRVSDPGAKKRRTFFSSNLPFLPKIAGTSRPATTPSDKVLAALLPPVSRDPSPERPSRARKQVRKDEELHQAASLDMVPQADLPKQPTPPRITRPIRTSASSKSLVVEPKASSVPWRKPSAVITNRRASAPVRTTKAQTAQSTNSKLSAALEMAMRSTISGRATPYMRDNTWNVMTVTSAKARGKIKEKEGAPGRKKEYMSAGFYCQDADAVSPHKLVSKVLRRQEVLQKVQGKGKGKGKEVVRPKRAAAQATTGSDHDLSFPPLPYDHGHDHFFGQEHEFVLPYNIQWEAENGSLDGKKKPTPFQKVRGNVFPERARQSAEHSAVCRCDPESRCGENCINRIMSYLCGKECPCGDACENRSLARRKVPPTKVVYTGSRGFGLVAMEDIQAGEFVIDYRGEVISLNAFYSRIRNEYANQRNFYALAYDQAEVIDAGMRGNDARFINHGCDPNLEVRKFQTLGDGMEEYEVGMWASRDIQQGEELFYDYNFENFGAPGEDVRTVCRCGAPNCIGFLGRDAIEKAPQLPDRAMAVPSRNKAAKKRSSNARSSLVIGSRAVEDSEQEGLVGDGSYELHTGDIPSTPDVPNVGMDEETPMAAGSSPLSEIKEIPLATRFWRIEPRSTARDIPTSPQLVKAKAGPVEAVPAASRAPPRSTLAPIPRSPPVTISPLIPRASPVPKPVPTTIAETGGLPSSNLLPPVFIEQPGYRATPVSSVPPITHLSPRTSRIVPDAAMTNVNSLDRSGGKIVHPPNDYMRTTSHPASAPLRTPLTPATPYNSRGTAAGPSPSSPADEFEDEAARRAAKRKSGWANWLKKQAGAKQRTLEEWHEERIKRRRGIAWMRMMIEEFGLAPSPGLPTAVAYSDGSKPAGSVMSFANTLAALGHPAGPSEIKRLGGPGPGKGKEKDKQKPKEKEVENRREQEEDMAKITPPATATQGAGPSNAPLETHFWTASIANGPEIETAIPTGSSKRWAEIAEQSTDSQSNKRGRLSRENDAVSQAESWDEPAADYPSSSLIPAIEQDANHAHDAAVSLTLAPITAMKIGGHDVDLTDVPSTPAPPTALESANARIDANGTSLIPTPSTAVETGNDNVDTETPLSAKETAKRKAIAARNGAPMGWAFVDPNVKIGSRLVSAVEPDLLRSARRSRASLASEEAIGGVSGQRRESFV